MEREDKRGIFLGIVGVLTLIVAIIGASFAYFSINAQSKENAVTVKAASVQIVYEDGDGINVSGIIPSTQAMAQKAQAQDCIDDNGYKVCGVYDFTLKNNGTQDVDVTAYIVPTALGEGETAFTHLSFILYDRTSVTGDGNGNPIYNGGTGNGTFAYTNFGILDSDITETMTLNDNSTKNLRLFVWLDEAESENDAEQGATFKGTVHIDVKGVEGGITGQVADE